MSEITDTTKLGHYFRPSVGTVALTKEAASDIMSHYMFVIGGLAEVAYDAIIEAEEEAIRAGIYKQKFKYQMNRVLQAYQKMQAQSLFYYDEDKRNFWVTYADAYALNAEPLVNRFKKNIRDVAQYRKMPNPDLGAALMVATDWLIVTENIFKSHTYNVWRETGYDFSSEAPFNSIGKVRKEMYMAADMICGKYAFEVDKYKRVNVTSEIIHKFAVAIETQRIPAVAAMTIAGDYMPEKEDFLNLLKGDPNVWRRGNKIAQQLMEG